MKYISTRGKVQPVESATAIIKGIAEDGGLYVPDSIPAYFPTNLAEMDYNTIANDIFSLYLSDFTAEEIADIVSNSYNENNFPDGVVGTASLGDTEVLELWHGPTSAFKDMALQALPHLLVKSLAKTGGDREIIILVATSGDTGKAALEGFADVPNTRIIIFYPKDGVSPIQELQMNTTVGKNTSVISIKGNFDDCQSGVKEIFADKALAQEMADNNQYFSSANSINWGRLLPQIVYYFYAYGEMVAKNRISYGEEIDIAVPTGNFGNILAAWYAMRMGLPVHKFYCASNRNNVLTEALEKGSYDRNRPFYQTISPSMDILISSNFERFIFDISDNDSEYTAKVFELLQNEGRYLIDDELREKFADKMEGAYSDEDQCQAAIQEVFKAYNYLFDPHTAVGYEAAQKLRGHNEQGYKLLLVSTASPYKFPEAVLESLNALPKDEDELALPGHLAEVSGTDVPKNLATLSGLPILHDQVCEVAEMKKMIRKELGI